MLKNLNIERLLITIVVFIAGALIGAGIGYALNPQKGADHSMGTSNVGTPHMDDHPQIEVSADLPIPSVNLISYTDTMGGYNLNIQTTNFTFTPQDAGKESVANTGHAHLTINGVKYMRVYGEWVNIPKSALKSGSNEIEVTLNGNDHAEWVVNGEHIAASVNVAN